jgi:hypothetical protein
MSGKAHEGKPDFLARVVDKALGVEEGRIVPRMRSLFEYAPDAWLTASRNVWQAKTPAVAPMPEDGNRNEPLRHWLAERALLVEDGSGEEPLRHWRAERAERALLATDPRREPGAPLVSDTSAVGSLRSATRDLAKEIPPEPIETAEHSKSLAFSRYRRRPGQQFQHLDAIRRAATRRRGRRSVRFRYEPCHQGSTISPQRSSWPSRPSDARRRATSIGADNQTLQQLRS